MPFDSTPSTTSGANCPSCPHRGGGLCALLMAEKLTGEVRQATYQRRTQLGREDRPLRKAYILRSGVVSVSRARRGGQRHILDFLMAGDTLGVFAGAAHHGTLSVLQDAQVCEVPVSALMDAGRSTAFLKGLVRLTELATDRLREHIMLLGKLKAEERLVAFLLRFRAACQRTQSMQARLDLPMTRRDIADHLGMAPETVSRGLTWLQQQQLVVTIPDGIRVLDLARLEALGGALAGLITAAAREPARRPSCRPVPMPVAALVPYVASQGRPAALIGRASAGR